jgi:aquaporin Z
LGLGIFMFSAGFFDMLIDYPGFFIRQHIVSALVRRFLIGSTMGLTALFIFTSRFGKASGAYINPSVTLVRYWLSDIDFSDGILYIVFQFVGGASGMYLIYLLFPHQIKYPDINYIITKPENGHVAIAFVMEFAISFLLMTVVLFTEKKAEWKKWTPYLVSALIVLFITFEAPYSGMSMNPARTFASAIVGNQWHAFWLYCLAPTLGMMLAGGLFKIKYLKTKK